MIDLHLHTRCSDGALTPTELVTRAHVKSVTALSITDHDTCAGNEEAMHVGEQLGVEVIPGVELSVQWGEKNFHLLGYGVSRVDENSLRIFKELAEARRNRLSKIVARLNDLNIPLSSREVQREAGGDVVGRLHVARAMKRLGYVTTIQEAFVCYLGRGAAAYVDRPRLSLGEAVVLIRDMGGVTSLAHPGVFEKVYPGQLETVLRPLLEQGLDGIEACYARHSPEQITHYTALADAHSLLVTGGSDFHRPPPNGPELGAAGLPYARYEQLRERITRQS